VYGAFKVEPRSPSKAGAPAAIYFENAPPHQEAQLANGTLEDEDRLTKSWKITMSQDESEKFMNGVT